MHMPLATNQPDPTLKLHRDGDSGEVSCLEPWASDGAKPPVPNKGTVLAVSNLDSGVAGHLPHRTTKGGARNRADRESHALTAAQIGNLKAARRHAKKIGLPFNRMISIHWEAAGLPLAGMAKATGRFLDLMTKALARRGSRTAWLWVHENGDGKGGHCHVLVHVPAALVPTLTGLQRRWLRSITGQSYRRRVIHSDPIGGRLDLEVGNPDLHATNLDAALAYVLKGADPVAARQFDLTVLEPGGCVIGKRCGTSQNISAKARAAHV